MQTGLQTDPQRAFRLMWSLFIRLCLLIQILWEQFHISIVPKAACFLYGPRNFLWFHFKWIKELNYRKAILALYFFHVRTIPQEEAVWFYAPYLTWFNILSCLRIIHITHAYTYNMIYGCEVAIQHQDTDFCLYFIKKNLTSENGI